MSFFTSLRTGTHINISDSRAQRPPKDVQDSLSCAQNTPDAVPSTQGPAQVRYSDAGTRPSSHSTSAKQGVCCPIFHIFGVVHWHIDIISRADWIVISIFQPRKEEIPTLGYQKLRDYFEPTLGKSAE